MRQLASKVTLTTIGGYQILEKVGAGGSGSVYRGRNPITDKIVAIKVIPPEATANESLRMRFVQECQVARKLNHPQIVKMIDYGLEGARAYLVMEYIEGESLGERLQREGRLAEAEALAIIEQVGQGLAWAHLNKILHRDVKPDNILLRKGGEAKLADLGLAKNLDGDFDLTKPMSGLGTPNFMAPEQFQDAKHVDARADLYSLAATLYTVVTGLLPFRTIRSNAIATILRSKLANDLVAPKTLVPELSEAVNREILRAMRADRDERHPSVEAFLNALPHPANSQATSPEEGEAGVHDLESAQANKRARSRYASRRTTICRTLERFADKVWQGHVVNISETGLCLELNRRFEPGAFLTIALEAERTVRQSLVARVVWVKNLSSKKWRLGCHFDSPLGEGEVLDLR